MSSNTSGAPCYTCAHGSMCTVREQYLKFYEHRDQVMCKVGFEGSVDNEVDTSNEIQISVEHRYMNGPGLEDLYTRLGLSAPSYCCLVPQNRCPLHRPGIGSYDRDYFDSPIVNKWNAPLGYISSICEPDKWEPHKYHLPYKRPFIPVSGPCKSCFQATGNKPKKAELIAGTPYSTFAVTTLKVRTGTELVTADIVAPENIMPHYSIDTETTPETYHIEGENTKVVIYYHYVPKTQTPTSPGLWIEDSTMEERGLMHNVVILYGNKAAFTYRPFKKKGGDSATPEAERIKCRILSVRSAYRRLTTRYSNGDEMGMKKTLVKNDISATAGIETPTSHIQYVVDNKRDSHRHPFIPADDEYVELRLAKGDTVDFEISVPATHNLFFKMMEYMGTKVTLISTHFTPGRVEYHLRHTVGDADAVLHMCLIDLQDKTQFAEERIDYPDLNQAGIELTPFSMTIISDNGHVIPVLTKLAPRAWNNVDEDHMSWSTNLPTSWSVDRKGFKLSGYVDAVADAIAFRPDTEIKQPGEYEDRVFKDVRFTELGDINNREPGYSAYAKWEIDFNTFFMAHTMMFRRIADNCSASVRLTYPNMETVQMAPMGNPSAAVNYLPAISVQSPSITNIKETVKKVYDELMADPRIEAGDFQMKLVILPKEARRLRYRNGTMPLSYEAEVDYINPEKLPPEDENDDPLSKDDGFMIPDDMAELQKDGVNIRSYMTGDNGGIEQGEIDDPFDDEEPETPSTVPSTPLTPATPSGSEVPSIPLTPATPTGDEVPSIPLQPATSTIETQFIDCSTLEGLDTLNALEANQTTPVIMFIEPAQDKAFFMNAAEFTFVVQPLYITLERCPLEVAIIFDCEPMQMDESPAEHLIDTVFTGLDPIHQDMVLNAEDPRKLITVDFDPEERYAPFVAGELADRYYLINYLTSRAIEVKVTYVLDGETIKTEKWRAPADKMVTIKTDISSTGKYFRNVLFKEGHKDAMDEATILYRDPETNALVSMPDIEIGQINIHTLWNEDAPLEYTAYFDGHHDCEFVVELMREQLDPNAYCARCAGYVDTSTEEFKSWLTWVPDCLKYTPLH